MALKDVVKPIHGDHSIKEAVISLFLATPIIKPERFQKLIELALKDSFHQYEPLFQVQFNLEAVPGSTPIGSTEFLNNNGFKFTAFKNGKPERILQGLNDTARIYLSYHTLDYERWIPFLANYMKTINSVNEFNSGFFVKAFSLQYVDEFLWIGKEAVDHRLLFKESADFLPKQFYNSNVSVYSFVTQQAENTTNNFSDRIDIKVERVIRPSILISHNVAKVLPEVTDLKALLNGTDFSDSLTAAHLHNQAILKDVLNEEARDMIKLK